MSQLGNTLGTVSDLNHYKFGRYSISLMQNNNANLLIGSRWHAFVHSDALDDGIILRMEENLMFDQIQEDGWHHMFQNGEHVIVYREKGIEKLSFKYKENDCFLISNSVNNRLAGGQFALLLGLAGKAFGLHGVTVICEDKVIILSAPSGTGKSTLGRLLHDHCDAAIVNGDFALLTPEADGRLMFEPPPFCGTSGVCHNYRLKVDRIVFLEQAKENTFDALPPMQALTRLLSNTFVPPWDEEKALAVQQNALRAVASVPMNRFAFAPTREAAEMFHALVTQE